MRRTPNLQAIKALYAASGGICAFPGCAAHLVDPDTGAILGDVCHIHAISEGGPRYSPALTDTQRNSTDNLIVLCPNHHRLIDAKPSDYPASALRAMKQQHETIIASRLAKQEPDIDDKTAIDLTRQVQDETTDFAIIVALPKELEAVLRRFPELREITRSDDVPRTYYTGTVATNSGFRYRVVTMLLRAMGNLEAANATHDLIKRWSPRYILVNGIAGGLCPDAQQYGDVLVAETVVYYELGKERDTGLENRNRHFPCDPSLLDSARNLRSTDWRDGLPARPDQCLPKHDHPAVHFGPLASGEKVVASSDAVNRLLRYQPDLVGIEMESAGVASAALGAVRRIGFLSIRAICDFADHQKSDNWQQYAAAAAAAFLRAFIKSQPIRPSSGGWPRPLAHVPERKPQDDLAKRNVLFNQLCGRLDMEELKNLCFLLGVDIDELPADRKSSRARELILYFERHEKLHELVSALEDMLNDDEDSG